MDAKKILVVDDESEVRKYFARIFTRPEYEVDCAASGQEALDKIAAHAFDMMILDLVMPGMSGMEVLKSVRRTHKEMIVLVVTGYPSEESTQESIESGCIDYVHKPFDHEEIMNLVKDAFEARRYKLRHRAPSAQN